MSRTDNNHLKMQNILQQLYNWSKKPSLDHEFSEFLDYYCSCLNNGDIRFAEAGLLMQRCTIILEKKIDLLHKQFLDLCTSLCTLLRRPEPEQSEDGCQNEKIKGNVEPNTDLILKKQKQKKCKKDVQDNKESSSNDGDKNVEKIDCPPSEQNSTNNFQQVENNMNEAFSLNNISIPGLPDDILKMLNVTDCNLNDCVKECLKKIEPTHPLYSVFAKIGDEISRTKNFITYNDISLSGKSWNALYLLENLLEKNNPVSKDDCNPVTSSESTLNELEINNTSINGDIQHLQENEINKNNETLTENNCINDTNNNLGSDNNNSFAMNNPDVQQNTDSYNTTINSAEIKQSNEIEKIDNSKIILKDLKINLLRLPQKSTGYFEKKSIETGDTNKCKTNNILKELRINLLRLPHRVLLKKNYFKLSAEYFQKENNENSMISKNETLKKQMSPRKRQREMEKECMNLIKKLKMFDLEKFEQFCYEHNVREGICSPLPETIFSQISRKSIDTRSEISFGYPVTPDSGRFSLTCHTDSEFETNEDMDTELDQRPPPSRADSGVVLSPIRDSFLSETELDCSEANPTLEKLKKMFPNTFSDPKRTELLKEIVLPPEEENKSENYLDWERFINEKAASDVEFNISEYGTDILNMISSKSKNETVSFHSIVKNKSIRDISRYFLSTLDLACTHNVEICNDFPGEVRPEGLKLKFLSNVRPERELNHSSSQQYSKIQSTPVSSCTFSDSKKVKRRRIDYKP